MPRFNSYGRSGVVALAADGMLSGDAANSGNAKMLFMLIAAFVLYSDFYAPPVSIGHCGTVAAVK